MDTAWLGEFAARLPDPAAVQLWMRAGWAVVLTALAAVWGQGWAQARLRYGVWLAAWAVAALLPAPWGLAYWLGLGLQSPSLVLVAWALARALVPTRWRAWSPGPWAWVGALAGGVLLADTYAVWPLFLYPVGFAPHTVVVLALALGAWWVWSGPASAHSAALQTVLLAVLVFALWPLPTGNVWDALLDPLLWLLCLGHCVAQTWRWWRRKSEA